MNCIGSVHAATSAPPIETRRVQATAPLEKWKNHLRDYEIHLVNRLVGCVLDRYDYPHLKPAHSRWLPTRGEDPRTYLANRMARPWSNEKQTLSSAHGFTRNRRQPLNVLNRKAQDPAPTLADNTMKQPASTSHPATSTNNRNASSS